MKRCCKCQKEKDFECFYKSSKVKDGYSKRCKDCDKTYRVMSREKYNLTRQKWRDTNREDIREYHRNYRGKHKESLLMKKRENREKRGKDEWNYKNREKINARRTILRQTNPNYKLRDILRNRVRAVLKENNIEKNLKSNELLGCSVDEARKYIESLWLEGMSWDNHGFGDNKWHIDHIIPCASFDLTNEEQQKKCFHYTNLQPLWQPDNLTKGNKITQA
jgi:hypothetical protein